MKKKTTTPSKKKPGIKLARETVKYLGNQELAQAAGGRISYVYCLLSDYSVILTGTVGTLCPND